MNKVSPILILLFLAAILALSPGCARKPDEAKISSEIQTKFSQDSGLSTKHLTAQASNGVVTLEGVVDNDAQRQAASRQAAAIEGVKQVVNNLQVSSVSDASLSSSSTPSSPTPSQTKVSETKPPRLKSTKRKAAAKQSDRIYSIQDTAAENDSTSNTVAENSELGKHNPQDNPPAPPSPPPAPPQPQTLTIEQGTQMSVRLIDSIDSEKNQMGDIFHATLNAPLSAGNAEGIPPGTDVTGHIVEVKSAGKFAGQSLVVLQLDSIKANGKSYSLQTDQYRKEGKSRGKNTAEKVGGGAIIGGIIGAIAGGGKGAAIGSAAGAGVGGGAQAASKSQQIKLPSETVLNFTLQAALTVVKAEDPNAARQKLGDSQ
jgi:BON domain-containing protein